MSGNALFREITPREQRFILTTVYLPMLPLHFVPARCGSGQGGLLGMTRTVLCLCVDLLSSERVYGEYGLVRVVY